MTSDITFKSTDLIRLRDEFFAFRTAKDDMIIEAINFNLNSILGPSVKSHRDQFSDQSLNVFLIAENHETHTHPDIVARSQRTGVVPN
jgi:hypothetical protein